jgi:hypothetical protein
MGLTIIGPSVGIQQGKMQSQGRSLGAIEAEITADFRFGKETTAVDDNQKIVFIISLRNGRGRSNLNGSGRGT